MKSHVWLNLIYDYEQSLINSLIYKEYETEWCSSIS